MIISCFADDMMYDIVNGTGDVSGFVIFLYVVYMIYALILLIPEFALCVRRLHDTGKSGWYMLIAFIPIIGAILLLVAMCTDSTPGHNKYGPNPKGVNPYGGNPYGGNPYGGNPYGGNPYGGNPYNR